MPDLPPTAQRAVDIVARQAATLSRLIDDLIDINRLNQGKVTLQVGTVYLQEVVRHAVEAVQPPLQQHRHALALHVADEPLHVQGDAVRLTQVVLNLLSNAVKYTPDGGRIVVSLERAAADDGEPRGHPRRRYRHGHSRAVVGTTSSRMRN